MKLVLTNDDGIDEPGMGVLETLCRAHGEVVVVAPSGPRSAISHTVTERGEIRVDARGPGRFAVDGTPADCARLALRELAPDADWLISGINAGANLGADVYVSGTVAAAREAALHGRPALAISQYIRRFQSLDWRASAGRAERVLAHVLERECEAGAFWSANLPHPADESRECAIVECPLDPSPAGIGYARSPAGFTWDGDYHGRPRRPGHDVAVCFGGRTALTFLHVAHAAAAAPR